MSLSMWEKFTAIIRGCLTAWFLVWLLGGSVYAGTAINAGDDNLCPQGKAVETNGQRRLALVVGVGRYQSDSIPDLEGQPNDAKRLLALLTDPDGYGFPRENVCLLLDEQATAARFKEKFEQALVARARAQDVAVIFYAGYGSQRKNDNGEEADRWDDTFLFHDARSGGVGDFSADEFNRLLVRLHEKTHHITVILDSSNSGTATRGEAGTYIARFQPPAEERMEAAVTSPGVWQPPNLPGLVVFAAAGDGTAALEKNGHGIFTDALLEVLEQVGKQPLSYAQAAGQIALLVASEGYQIPYFQGDLDRPVFGNEDRTRPLGWKVVEVADKQLQLRGPPLPGIGRNAELRLYDGTVTGADSRDPGKAKATLLIDAFDGLTASAHVEAAKPDAPAAAQGDLAVLVRPGDDALRISVRLRPPDEPGGIPKERAEILRKAVQSDAEAAMLVTLTSAAGDYELSVGDAGKLILRGPENRIRVAYQRDAQVPENLWQHARRRALLKLRGEGGGDFTDNRTLQVSLVPAGKQNRCVRHPWQQAEPNGEQSIPLCQNWNVRVKLADDAPKPLLVGGVVLYTDGRIFGFPSDGRLVRLEPGQQEIFDAAKETFQGSPPLDVQDHVLVFGTQQSNPVPWNLLTDTAKNRAGDIVPKSGLYRALDQYLQPEARGEEPLGTVENSTWTMSAATMRVQANPGFGAADAGGESPQKSAYTIPNFDIRPYLPDDPESALYKVLKVAERLAKDSATDGIPYQQHAWAETGDEANLKLGIDCSRAIWFAFTRAGLPYNSDDRYLPTAAMVGENSAMKEQFQSCSDDERRIGDVLVYRDAHRNAGHTVMVIDPDKRIAWGSLGWDGNVQEGLETEPGVEYQLIKYRQDWERWDRGSMRLAACWRYRQFAEEASAERGQPGGKALTKACDCQ